jgi:hypothetical protein
MTMKSMFVLLAVLLVATAVAASDAGKGAKGGMHVHAGAYHLEVVAQDKTLTVYLHDNKDKPVDAKGYRAVGILVVDGKSQRIELKADSANTLTGTATVALPATLKGVVQITLPTGKTVQGKLE